MENVLGLNLGQFSDTPGFVLGLSDSPLKGESRSPRIPAGPEGVSGKEWEDAPTISYTLFGDPQAWVRPRSNGRRHFTPQHVLDEEQRHREAALLCRPEGWPMDAGYVVHIDFFVGTVKSGPRKGKRKRIDTDNAVKLVFDGLTGAAWLDDEQVDDHHVRRRVDALDPRTEIRVAVREVGE